MSVWNAPYLPIIHSWCLNTLFQHQLDIFLWKQLMENLSNITNTVNSNQYRVCLCRLWQRSPDPPKKSCNFGSCWVRRKFLNFVNGCLWQILHYLGDIPHELFKQTLSVSCPFVCFLTTNVELPGKNNNSFVLCLFTYRVGKWDQIPSGHSRCMSRCILIPVVNWRT